MGTHVKVIAVLFLLMGVLLLMGAMASSLLFGALAGLTGSSGDPDASVGVAVLGLTGAALTLFFAAYSVPHFLAAWGLWKLRPWGRIVAIIMSALALFKFWPGTIFGIYALFILFQKDTERLFAPPVSGS